MKLFIVSMIVLGVSVLNTNNAMAKGKPADKPAKAVLANGVAQTNSKDGICVFAKKSKNKETFCAAGKSLGGSQGLEKILVRGQSVACHSKKDASCKQALALVDEFLSQPEVVVAEPIKEEPVVVVLNPEPIGTEPVSEPVKEEIVCDIYADRTCQARLDEQRYLEEKRLAASVN